MTEMQPRCGEKREKRKDGSTDYTNYTEGKRWKRAAALRRKEKR
jgi:hypothetical protein